MKALTVQQPWAWAIVHGGKLIENRTANWSYRGPLAIHAGLRWSGRGSQSDLVHRAWYEQHSIGYTISGRLPEWQFEKGAIIGLVDLVDVHPDGGCCRPWGESAYTEAGGRTRRAVTHLVLENSRPLAEPLVCAGALGLWTPPDDITRRIETLGEQHAMYADGGAS
ncbi:ASCH domain-containing protein [Gordonia alkanivorans]|uniref:ASCH domain-containing protein n=1 Tax=Gordonia alkanivorans TaxID=84096 RepID=UPI0024B7B631|nr:ASCH domain-containing protein [Gordonia alkanivorans]MDJ0006489.1 ASCH domain-containing protein [Gordonia alkanivorans]MDJ0492117.1 ASCH domain-containing protein [Gordonia alkanivorans]